jgi:nitrogen fixation protein
VRLPAIFDEEERVMSIEQRMQRLERTNTRLRAALIAVVALNGWMFLVGAADTGVPDVVRARRFEMVTGELANEVLVEISATPNGEGAIITYNKNRFPLVDLRPRAEGPGWVTTYDGRGHALVEMGATVEGDGALAVSAANGYRLAMLRSMPNGGGVYTFDRKGFGLVELGATAEGRGTLRTLDGTGREMVMIGVSKDGTGTLLTRNQRSQAVVSVDADEAGAGKIELHDGAGHVLQTLAGAATAPLAPKP